jgi:hypothetical protein
MADVSLHSHYWPTRNSLCACGASYYAQALSNLPGPWIWIERNGKYWRVHPRLAIEDGPHKAPAPLRPSVGMLDESDRTLHKCSEFHLVTACGLRPEVATVGPLGLLHLKSRQLCPECWNASDRP